MARDYLAIPAAGVGVERLFNKARDICSYRRHHLKAGTIRLLIMLMCIDQFNLQEDYRSADPIEDLEEDREEDDIDSDGEHSVHGLISDDEEDWAEADRDRELSLPSLTSALTGTSPRPRGLVTAQRRWVEIQGRISRKGKERARGL
jgi:hypothetical protein